MKLREKTHGGKAKNPAPPRPRCTISLNDGFLDLFLVNGNDYGVPSDANFLYHNRGNANAWLRVKLIGTASNRDGAGAKVRAKATFAGQTRWQRRDMTAGDIFNGNNFIAHLGPTK